MLLYGAGFCAATNGETLSAALERGVCLCVSAVMPVTAARGPTGYIGSTMLPAPHPPRWERRVAMHRVTCCWTAAALMPTSRPHRRLRTPRVRRGVSHHERHLVQSATRHSRDSASVFSGGRMSPRPSLPSVFATQPGRLVSRGRFARCSIKGMGAEALRAHVDGMLPDRLAEGSCHQQEDADSLHDSCLHA